MKLLKRQYKPLEEIVEGLPEGLSRAVSRAMAVEPKHRFESCGAFAKEVLRHVPAKGKGSAPPTTPRAPAARTPALEVFPVALPVEKTSRPSGSSRRQRPNLESPPQLRRRRIPNHEAPGISPRTSSP